MLLRDGVVWVRIRIVFNLAPLAEPSRIIWAPLIDTSKRYDELRIVSTKTGFGFEALFGWIYTATRSRMGITLDNPAGEWDDGRYDADAATDGVDMGSTSGIVLEGLCYGAPGPMLRLPNRRD
jgi:hypothetical protein